MIKDRVVQILEYKGIAKEDFYVKIGMTSASFRGKAKNTPLNSSAIENILSEIPGINSEWLITGKGDMFISSAPSTPAVESMEDKLIGIIHEKDLKIEEQARAIGRLEAEVEFLHKKSDSSTGAEDATCAAAVG